MLAVYVVWHPASARAAALAECLFTTLCTDPDYPARRGLGIPVRFRTSSSSTDVPGPVPTGRPGSTAVVVLADANLIVDAAWRGYVSSLAHRVPDDLVIPVALVPVEHLPRELTELRTFPLVDVAEENQPAELLRRVMHDLALFIEARSRQVKVFISHAKQDGLAIATVVRRHLHEIAGLDDFFDAADVSYGSPLAEEITRAAGNAFALLAIQTDSYASREWCRLEVLEAKRRRVPIVVLAAVRVGESRAFPYLGNVPVVRWEDDSSLPAVVSALLREVLGARYFPRRVRHLCRLYGLDPDHQVFAYPPELLTALLYSVDASAAGRDVGHYLYPDPPLGTEELELIRMMEPRLTPVTPTTLWAS